MFPSLVCCYGLLLALSFSMDYKEKQATNHGNGKRFGDDIH